MNALTTNRLNKVIILEALDLAKSTNRSVSRARAIFAAVGSVCKSVTLHQLAIATAVGIAAGFVAYTHAPNYSKSSKS